jgi:CxxC motif-containing protein (DUF1111 family)
MKTKILAAASFTLLVQSCGGADEREAPERVARALTTALGDPFPGLPPALASAFESGAEAFAEVEDVADGLGPVFNGASCAECHAIPAVGGAGTQIETRFGKIVGGTFDPLTNLGGSLIQSKGITGVPGCPLGGMGETVPAGSVTGGRRTTPLFGLGLVDAVADSTLVALAAAEPPAVRGRVNFLVDPTTGQTAAGRFGWKDQVTSLQTFAADAYLNEMGITNPVFPTESKPNGSAAVLAACDTVAELEDDGEDVTAFRQFMQLLAPPPVVKRTGQAKAGENEFVRIGCADCHTATLTTGANAIAVLNHVEFHPYSDFLLHDMGALGDGIAQGSAGRTEMRTSPLWGVSHQPSLLHDGRTTSLEAAILAHDGQAATARAAFAALNAQNRQKIIAFLDTL